MKSKILKTISDYKMIAGYVILICCGFYWYSGASKAMAEQSEIKTAITQLTAIQGKLEAGNAVLMSILVSDPVKRERLKVLPSEPLVDSLGRLIIPQTIFLQGDDHKWGLIVSFKDETQAELVWDIRAATE